MKKSDIENVSFLKKYLSYKHHVMSNKYLFGKNSASMLHNLFKYKEESNSNIHLQIHGLSIKC